MHTVRHHHPGRVELVTLERFAAELWHEDRDIDLAPLRPALRANFVRAYLLAHYGGCWLDSDFLCFKPLPPIWAAARGRTFAAYRAVFNGFHLKGGDRADGFDNDFLWAEPGSPLAAEFYRLVCEVHRQHPGPLAWGQNGGDVLTPLIEAELEWVIVLPADYISPFRCMSVMCAADSFDDGGDFEPWEPPPTAYGMMLVNSSIRREVGGLSLTQILTSRTLLGIWMRAAWRKMSPGLR